MTDHVPELVVAGVLFVIGAASLARWLRTHVETESPGERLLVTLNLTARVGIWFALSAFFLGYALVDEPQSLGWFVFVVLSLAGLRLMTSFYLWRAAAPASKAPEDGKGRTMSQEPEDIDKRGETNVPGRPQPEAAEVESARLLANDARETLLADGLTNDEIRTLADEFIADHVGEGLPEFIDWARARAHGSGEVRP